MIESIKVRNLRGFNYNLNLNASFTKQNIVELDSIQLFASFQISGDSYQKFIEVFNVLIILLDANLLSQYCNSLSNEPVSIELTFHQMQESTYVRRKYLLELSKYGILKELINNKPLAAVTIDNFKTNIPEDLELYIRQMFVFDLMNPVSLASLNKFLKLALKMSSFLKFFNNFMFNLLKFPVCELTVTLNDEILVHTTREDKTVNSKIFDSCDDNFRTLCYLSWLMYITFLKSGVIVIHNLDRGLDTYYLFQLLAIINNPDCIKRNPTQFIFSSRQNVVVMLPEQKMSADIKEKNTIYCSWIN